jgi:hypothetical protein
MTLKEAHILTLRVLKQVMEEKLDQHNVQLAQVRTYPAHVFHPNEILYIINRLPQSTGLRF